MCRDASRKQTHTDTCTVTGHTSTQVLGLLEAKYPHLLKPVLCSQATLTTNRNPSEKWPLLLHRKNQTRNINAKVILSQATPTNSTGVLILLSQATDQQYHSHDPLTHNWPAISQPWSSHKQLTSNITAMILSYITDQQYHSHDPLTHNWPAIPQPWSSHT